MNHPTHEPKCEGDPGECAYNGACMYHCGRTEPPKAEALALAAMQARDFISAAAPGREWVAEHAAVLAALDAALAAAASPPHQPVHGEPLHASVVNRIWKECRAAGLDRVAFAWSIQREVERAAAPPAVEAGQVLTDEQIDRLQEEYDCYFEAVDVRIHDFARGVERVVRANLLAASTQAPEPMQPEMSDEWRTAVEKLNLLPVFLAGFRQSEQCLRNGMQEHVTGWIDGLKELHRLYDDDDQQAAPAVEPNSLGATSAEHGQ